MRNAESKLGRTIKVNPRLRAFKERASAMLCSEPASA